MWGPMASCVWLHEKPCIGVPPVVEVTPCCEQCACWCVKALLNVLGHVRSSVWLHEKPCMGAPPVVEVASCCEQCACWCAKALLNVLGHVRSYEALCFWGACKAMCRHTTCCSSYHMLQTMCILMCNNKPYYTRANEFLWDPVFDCMWSHV